MLDIVANEISSLQLITKQTARIISLVYDFEEFSSGEVYHILEKEYFKFKR